MYQYENTTIDSNVRTVKSIVEVSNEETSTLYMFTRDNDLVSWEISRTGDSNKFFGYGVIQKVNIKIRDIWKRYTIPAGAVVRISFIGDDDVINRIGQYKITETHRDETTNQLSITAYDYLYWASSHYIDEIDTSDLVDGEQLCGLIANHLGIDKAYLATIGTVQTYLDEMIESLNIEGSETLREILDDIAEVLGCVYYTEIKNGVHRLKFYDFQEREDLLSNSDKEIPADLIYSISTGDNRRLKAICSTTSLGDNVEASIEASGTTQYLRDNVFLTGYADLDKYLNYMIEDWGGITLPQFTIQWRGDYNVQPWDILAIATDRNSTDWIAGVASNDTLTYDGSFQMKSEWQYKEDEAETANSSTLGDRLKETYAFVDKANKQIDMVVSDVNEMNEKVASIGLTTDTISARVEEVSNSVATADQENKAEINKLKQENEEEIENIYGAMDVIAKNVDATITADDLKIEVSKQLSDGVDKVITSTGFTFDETGLTVSKSESEISTTITEDGMQIFRNSEAVLTANNKGVDAYNLHATTYLIVGQHSRFEDYGERTGCFWISESQSSATADIMEIKDEMEVV